MIRTLAVLTLLASAPAALAQDTHPRMYLDSGEIVAIKAQVETGAAPWKAAYDRMISDANAALSQGALSVTFGGRAPSSGTPHDYWSEAPYKGTRDGIINPAQDRTDYMAAIALGRAVRNLGLAYAFTGEARYADKAAALLNAWMVNPQTRMNPKFTNNQSRIELCITMPGAFYGADLIWNAPSWSAADRAAVSSWARTFGVSARSWTGTNNLENWRHVLLASAGVAGEDPSLRQEAFDGWKNFLARAMAADGRLVHETRRTKSLEYSTYALNAMVQVAEIARHFGVDLYSYRLSDGRGLEKTLDYHVRFVSSPSSWIYQQIVPYAGGNSAVYEIAYLWKQKDSYLAAINRWGRPMNEIRVMGPTTLSHAFGAYPLDFTSIEKSSTVFASSLILRSEPLS
jgi:hypothetical protein